jgi:rod shape-determining protein MreB
MAILHKDLGIDLGTVNVLVCESGQIVLHEPSIAAIEVSEQKIVALGQEARDMYGRVSENIEVTRPLRDGVIADYEVTERMLSYFIKKVCGPLRLFKPRTMISVPWGVTNVESRAVHEAAMQAGSRAAFLIPEPLAAAIGAGLPIQTPTGNMVVNMGGGITEAAVVSMNGIVSGYTARVGGIKLDEAIANYTRKKYGLVVGEPTAEEAKVRIGAAILPEEELAMEMPGRDQVTGLPRTVSITTGEVVEAMQEPLSTILGVVKGALERTPPELASDIIDRGMVLTGGVALLRGIDKLLTKETGVPAYVAENPMACVATGAGKALDQLELYRRVLSRAGVT